LPQLLEKAMNHRTVLPALLLLLLGGCAGTDWSRNVYEGIRQQRETKPDPTAAQPPAPQPDYEQYKRERDALKGG
jgi:hypothetical protein